MLIMTQDRISGISSENPPLSTYGPGNTRDESNRNSWVSSSTTDRLDISCLTQVSGLFLGRYQADKIYLTYKGVDLYKSKTATGYISVGYTSGTNGYINGVLDEIITGDTTFYYQGGTILKIKPNSNQSSAEMNVNDFVTISSTNGTLDALINGTHRIVAVQTDNVLSKLDSDKNTVVEYTNTFQDYYYIHIIDTVASSLLGEPISASSGITDTLTAGSGFLENWSDTQYYYDVTLGYPRSSRFVNEEVPFDVGNYLSFSGLSIQLADGTVIEDMSATGNSYPIVSSDENSLTFVVRVYKNISTFYNPADLDIVVVLSNASFSTGTTIFYNGGGYRHLLGSPSGATTSNTNQNFSNNEVVTFSNFNSLTNNSLSYIFDINSADDNYFLKSFVKNNDSFSIKSPYNISPSSSFTESSANVVEIRKYVLDTDEASTTNSGAGTPIRKHEITTRIASSLSGFVTGEITKVESNYIPLPREGYDSNLTIEFESNVNHNRSGLFKEFLLEELEVIDFSNEAIKVYYNSDIISNTGPLYGKTYKSNFTGFTYNRESTGKIELTMTSHNFSVGDVVYMNFNTSYYSTDITIGISSFDSGLVQYQMSSSVEDLYEGMKVGSAYISSINYSNDTLILSENIGVTSGSLNFEHSQLFEDEVIEGLNRIHVIAGINGNTIEIYAPNVSVYGDMTVNTQQSCTGFLCKVGRGAGRFTRKITDNINSADHFIWNTNETGDIYYTVNSVSYKVEPGEGYLFFSGQHELVNNDKILMYNMSSSTGGGENLYGLESSYLVEYNQSNIIKILLKTSKSLTISSGNLYDSGLKSIIYITTTDHGLSVGDNVSILGSNSSDPHLGHYEVLSIPTSKSFIIEYDSAFSSSYSVSSGSVVTGFHYLTNFSSSPQKSGSSSSASSSIQNIPLARTVSIADAASAYENPISVGNHVFLDGYYNSSGEYSSVVGSGVFPKTPQILDSITTGVWRSDSDQVQKTYLGPVGSLNAQIYLVRGDGTDIADIHVINGFGELNRPIEFTSLLNAVRVAILRAGVSRELPNPQVGVNGALKDFSVRKELPTGAYYYLNRAASKEFAGKLISDPESVDRLLDFGATQLAKPFPCLIISGTKGNMKKLRTRTALYGYFASLPTATYSNKLYNLKEATFAIKEVL